MTRNAGMKTDRRRLIQAAGLGAGGALSAMALGGKIGGFNAASAQDSVTLTVWTPGGSPLFCQMQDDVANDYEAVNSAVKIDEVQCGVGTAGDFNQVLLAAIAAGNPPDTTLIWQTPVAFGARGVLQPLDDWMAASQYAKVENWPAGLLSTCQFEGVTYGLPVTAGIYGMWYNAELFDAKGIPSDRASFPKTWDDFKALSAEFVEWDGDTLKTAGFFPWGLFWNDNADPLPIWSALNGSQLYDAANQKYTLDSEQNIEMLEYAVTWLDEQYQGDINKVLNSGQSWGAYATENGPAAFQAGNMAGMEAGSWLMGDLYAEVDPVFTNWNVAAHPVGPSGTTAVSGSYPNWLVIPDKAAHPAEAFGYLDYLSGVGVQRWFSTVPDIPTNSAAPLTSPQVVIDKRGQEFADDIMTFWREQTQISTNMWDSPVQDFARDQLVKALEKIFTKTQAPKDALAEAQTASQGELDKLLAG